MQLSHVIYMSGFPIDFWMSYYDFYDTFFYGFYDFFLENLLTWFYCNYMNEGWFTNLSKKKTIIFNNLI
jgi:hypothetical protein